MMEKVTVRFNDLHDKLLKIPGHYALTFKNDIINISKAAWETELKEMKNANGELMFPLHIEEKPKKPAVKAIKEEKTE